LKRRETVPAVFIEPAVSVSSSVDDIPRFFNTRSIPFEDQRVQFGSPMKHDIAQLVADRFFRINGKLVRSPA
jgi:hypothetical protein